MKQSKFLQSSLILVGLVAATVVPTAFMTATSVNAQQAAPRPHIV
jgi:hypothetical protein